MSTKGSGVVKKVFPTKRDAYGFMKILTPIELRGQEAAFYFSDINTLDAYSSRYVQHGMLFDFTVIDKPDDFMKSPVPFKAIKIVPQDPAEYQATVIRFLPPSPNNGMIVCLDLTLSQVKIEAESYRRFQRETSLLVGDQIIVRISWQEMINSAARKIMPTGDIVSICEKTTKRQRSSSQSEVSHDATLDVILKSNMKAPSPEPEIRNEPEEETETDSDSVVEPEKRHSRRTCIANDRRRCRSSSESTGYEMHHQVFVPQEMPAGMCAAAPWPGHHGPPHFNPYDPRQFVYVDEMRYHHVPTQWCGSGYAMRPKKIISLDEFLKSGGTLH